MDLATGLTYNLRVTIVNTLPYTSNDKQFSHMLRWSLLYCGDIAACQFSREGALTITHLRLNFIVVTGLTAFILARLYRQEGGGGYL